MLYAAAFWLYPDWSGGDNLRDPGTKPFWCLPAKLAVGASPHRKPTNANMPFANFWPRYCSQNPCAVTHDCAYQLPEGDGWIFAKAGDAVMNETACDIWFSTDADAADFSVQH